MPNFICEELVMKNGKVDIVEQEFSKLWNDKIQRLEAENKILKEENEKLKELEKQNNTRKDIIYNLFSQNLTLADSSHLDEGIDIVKVYGNQHIDEWNTLHKEIYEDVVETMNTCEVAPGFHIEYDGSTHFDLCIDDSDDEDED